MAPTAVPSRDPLTDSTHTQRSLHVKTSYVTSSSRDPLSPAHSIASLATSDATFASTLRLPDRRGHVVTHPVAMSDRQLYELANDTSKAIDWDALVRDAQNETARWKWQENARDFSIFVKQTSESYAVLATGAVPCSVPELVTVLHAINGQQHVQKLSAFHGDQFKDGAHVYTVDLDGERIRDLVHEHAAGGDSAITELAVKTATFTKTNWLHRHEEWCYVDAVRRHRDGEIFEKLMTSLKPKDLVVGKSDSRTKYLHDVIGGILVKPNDPTEPLPVPPNSMRLPTPGQAATVQLTRVHFYAEFTSKKSLLHVPRSASSASEKTVKQRLLRMAQSCERFTQLIRRRRLGVQVLVDQLRILPPTNTACVCCDTSLLLAKLCRLCGQGACSTCSRKHEREVQARGGTRNRLELVRVCDRCMVRVDRSNYAHLTDRSLMGPVVFPSAPHEKPAQVALKDLLHEALLNAPSDEKKASVMNVIKCVLDQTEPNRPSKKTGRAPSAALHSNLTSVNDYVAALDSLEVAQVPHNQAEISANSGRAYLVEPGDASQQMTFPMPANEAERLRAIDATNATQIGHSDELNIICDLAAKELDSFASLVTIITEDEQHVIGANLSALENARFPRSHAFCSHTIMDDKPLVVPHPEADVRFQLCGPVQQTGARYYCGFPLVAEDNTTVIGALCCVDNKTHDMTESQYAALSKLAQTASKVVRLQGKQRRQSATTAGLGGVQYTQL